MNEKRRLPPGSRRFCCGLHYHEIQLKDVFLRDVYRGVGAAVSCRAVRKEAMMLLSELRRVMRVPPLIAQAALAATLILLGLCAAVAGCGHRPGTPNEEGAVAISDTEIQYSWRVATSGSIWYDIYVVGPNNENIGRNATGIAGLDHTKKFGGRDRIIYDSLQRSTRYCFSIRARDEPGTEGCISKRNSSWQCATTMAYKPSSPLPVCNTTACPVQPGCPYHYCPQPTGGSSSTNKCCWQGAATGFPVHVCGPQCP